MPIAPHAYRLRNTSALVAAVVLACGWGLPAQAHPLGNFTINHLAKVRIEPAGLSIRYIVDMAEIPTFQVMRERDIDGGRRDALLAQWGQDESATVKRNLVLRADGQALSLHAATPRLTTRPGAGGLPTLYFVDEFRAAFSKAKSPHLITINDRNYAGRIGWKDIVLSAGGEPTSELRSYPNALLGSPRSITEMSIRVGKDGRVLAQRSSGAPPPAPAGSSSQVRSNLLSDMLARGSSNPILVMLTVLVAIGLGALHALEPGHGKTLLAVSLVGSKATPRQAILLALALTFAHTAGVVALGIVLLVFARWIVPENVYPWVTLGSGVLVAIVGAGALSRFIKLRRGTNAASGHDHSHSHHHVPDHAHGASARTDLQSDRTLEHKHLHHIPPGDHPLSFRSVVVIAMGGNIAPCPAALVVLLTALTLHQAGYGLFVVVAFSIGLASMLTALGIAVVRGASWLSGRTKFDRLVRYGPLLTASIISLIGATMVAKAATSALQTPELPVLLLVLAAIAGFAFSPGHSHALRTETT